MRNRQLTEVEMPVPFMSKYVRKAPGNRFSVFQRQENIFTVQNRKRMIQCLLQEKKRRHKYDAKEKE